MPTSDSRFRGHSIRERLRFVNACWVQLIEPLFPSRQIRTETMKCEAKIGTLVWDAAGIVAYASHTAWTLYKRFWLYLKPRRSVCTCTVGIRGV